MKKQRNSHHITTSGKALIAMSTDGDVLTIAEGALPTILLRESHRSGTPDMVLTVRSELPRALIAHAANTRFVFSVRRIPEARGKLSMPVVVFGITDAKLLVAYLPARVGAPSCLKLLKHFRDVDLLVTDDAVATRGMFALWSEAIGGDTALQSPGLGRNDIERPSS